MSEQWYYAKDDQQQGPFTLDQMNEHAAAGKFLPTDLVWNESMTDWTPAASAGEIKFPPSAAMPASSPPPMPPRPAASRPYSARSVPKFPPIVWSILMFAGAGLLFLAFFVPWWGITIKTADEVGAETNREYLRVRTQSQAWQINHVSYRKRDTFNDQERELQRGERDKASIWEWGWNTGAGITGLIFSLLILPLAILPLCIKALDNWSWIGRFVSAIPGFIMLILFLVWFFDAPSKNVSPLLYQGLYVGPYLMFLAGLLLFFGGVLGGILGLMEFLAWIKSRPAATTPTAAGDNDLHFQVS